MPRGTVGFSSEEEMRQASQRGKPPYLLRGLSGIRKKVRLKHDTPSNRASDLCYNSAWSLRRELARSLAAYLVDNEYDAVQL
jgi:hypothetical protein